MARVHEWVKKQKRLYLEETYALLKRWNFDVVAHGPSLHDENSYYVIRRFDDIVFELDEVTVQGSRKKIGDDE